jgi:hypothetical protein
MSINIQAHRSDRRRHLPAEGFEQASLAILSRYKRLATGTDGSSADPSSPAEPLESGERGTRPRRPMTAGDH